MERALEVRILEEISRLSQASRDKDAPEGGIIINLILMDMLTHILLEKISIESFVVTTMKIPFKMVGVYYQEFFKNELV